MLDTDCNDDCCHGTSLPHRVDGLICVRCSCGSVVQFNPDLPSTTQKQCVCGIPLAESSVAGATSRELWRLRTVAPATTNPHKHPPVVYFAEVYFPNLGDHLIKIGTSGNVWLRMNAFKGLLLGVVPGWIREERAMHERFAHLRDHSEYFRRGPDLLEFIDTSTKMPDYAPPPDPAPTPRQPLPAGIVRLRVKDIIR
jgi:hypothetical protein